MNLESRLEKLEQELELERQVNREQARILHSILAKYHKQQEWADVPILAAIAFFGLLVFCLLSIRIEYANFSFGVPVEALLKALEVPAIASAVTAVTAVLMKRYEKS